MWQGCIGPFMPLEGMSRFPFYVPQVLGETTVGSQLLYAGHKALWFVHTIGRIFASVKASYLFYVTFSSFAIMLITIY